jgi:histidinol-phosphate aminotransferase
MSGINLRLNNGCYCPEACRAVLADFSGDFRLALYADEHNERLVTALAELHGVAKQSIVLSNGSGPLLRRGLPSLIENRIRSSVVRSAKHLVFGTGYPLVTPEMTYFKVPLGARRMGLRVDLAPVIEHERRFRVDVDRLDAMLARRPSVVYVVSPGNPNGTVVFDRAEMLALMTRRPDSLFWIDEAYVELLEPSLSRRTELIRHVPDLDNLIVSRSFSFAYGLAGARIGFAAAPPWAAKLLSARESGFRLGVLQEELALAALKSSGEHLPFIAEYMRAERTKLEAALSAYPSIEVFASDTHQVLCRFNDGRDGKWLCDRLLAHGIAIRDFSAEAEAIAPKLASFFRLCVGRREENEAFVDRLGEVLGQPARPLEAASA